MESVSNEIDVLEKTLHQLVRHPNLIRRPYWATQVECFLVQPGLRIRDRQRLAALGDLLSAEAPFGEASQ